MPLDDPTAAIWAVRRERAKRWRSADLRGSPALSLEDETEASLAADPPPVEERGKRKPAQAEAEA